MERISPFLHPVDYVNRKRFYSINELLTCDQTLSITDAYVGSSGSVHDARVFRNSDLAQQIKDDPNTFYAGGSYLLGDAAYPLSEQLIIPFRMTDNMTAEKRQFILSIVQSGQWYYQTLANHGI